MVVETMHTFILKSGNFISGLTLAFWIVIQLFIEETF